MKFDIVTFKRLLQAFEADQENEELQKEYLFTFSCVKDIALKNELKKLERLLNQKNLFDMVYAYQAGKNFAEKYPAVNPSHQPLDILVNTNRLYEFEEYGKICEAIREQKQEVYAFAGDEMKTVDLLLEIYSYYNYELIRFTFHAARQAR